jgi:hypothetical protein
MAQRHQWAKSIEHSVIGESLSIDSCNNSYMVGLNNDSMVIDGKVIQAPTTRQFQGLFLAKFDTKGKFIWVNTLLTFGNYLNARINGTVRTVSNKKVMVYGCFLGKVLKLTNTDSIINTNSYNMGFIATYDSSGKFIKAAKIFEGDLSLLGGSMSSGLVDIDKNGNFYIHFLKGIDSTSVIYTKGGVIVLKNQIERPVLVKYSPSLDSVIWYKELPDFSNFAIHRLRMGEDNNLYLACNARGKFTIDSVNYSWNSKKFKGFLMVLSDEGKFIHKGLINSDTSQRDYLIDVAAKSINNISIYGAVQDSILYNSKWYTPSNKKSSGNSFPFFGLISISNGAKWIIFTKDKGGLLLQTAYPNTAGRLNFDKMNNVYVTFYYYRKGIILGGLTDTNFIAHCLTKFDSLGNALFLIKIAALCSSVESDYDTNLIYTGNFWGQLSLFPHTVKAKVGGLYLAKIVDYSITRGKVSHGPYCAGDSLLIPYKKRGIYDTSNYFIAELSDENGNFEGKEKELGRIKSINNGTVKGVLPLFKVASSGNYRIRIRSTSPIIQSFYQKDSLRLLIYSRDKADPGPTETICYNDSILLNTYGGTKWTWSPKYNMADSNHRQTMAWPKTTTTYKIIIADSSGCGAPDTAFKKVIVRNPLKINLSFNDTSICQTGKLIVPFQLMGGDSVNNYYQWYFISSPKSWFPTMSGKSKSQDTLEHTPLNSLDKLAIILKDGCTNKADTAYLIISQRKPVTITSTYHDTTLCTGNLLKYKATATGGIPKQYRYQWKDLVTNSILSTTDSLKILTNKALKIQLIVNDGCEALGDTALFEVKVKAELKTLTNLRDTTICEGKSLSYAAQATGGDSKTYTYSWILNGKEISTSNILNLTSNILNLTSNLSLITKDNCSPNDTIKKTITVLPGPKADFTWDLACSRTVTKFKFTGTKPNSPITTQFNWNFNSEASSTLENPSHQFAKSGTSTSTLALTSSNGCTDTIKKSIVIKPQAKAEFEVKDVCENQTALFTNQSQDATGYLWKFGDGQTSNLPTPKHKYNITTTTTYNVTLVAQVLNGCADSISKALTINENPSSDFSYTYNGTKVDLKIAKGGNSYQWKFGTTDSLKTTATTYTHTIKSSDQHTVCLTATNLSGCSAQTCKNITVGILKLTEKSFKIFPNPNNGSFTIEMENPEMDAAIEVFDVMGKLVKKVERVEKVTLVNLDVESGIYLVKVKNGGVIWMRKILVSFGVDTKR